MADLRDVTEVARVRAAAADDQEARDRLESYVLRLLDEARDEVKNADSKTNIVFATVTFVIGYLAAVLFDDSSAFRTGSDAATAVATISLGVFLVALLLLALAVTPRLGKPAAGKARYFQEQAQFPDADAMLQAIATGRCRSRRPALAAGVHAVAHRPPEVPASPQLDEHSGSGDAGARHRGADQPARLRFATAVDRRRCGTW